MTKLIKNELFKIFHKKILYIVLIIAVAGTLFTAVMDKVFYSNINDLDLSITRSSIQMLEDEGATSSESYIELKTTLSTQELMKDKNIKSGTPEEYYVETQINPFYRTYYSYLYDSTNKDEDKANELKKQIDTLVNDLDNYNWKDTVNERISEVEESINESCDDENSIDCLTYKEELKTLNYRLEHNIPFCFNSSNSYLSGYVANYQSYLKNLDKKDEVLKHDELVDKRETEKIVNESKYMMEHNLLTNDYNEYNSGYSFVQKFISPSFMAIIVLLALSASVVAEEFNKGTIKQLLVKPFSRTKILISKYLSIIIASILFLFVINICTSIISGLFEGDVQTIISNVVVYNYHTHSCMEMNNIVYALISFVYSLPEIILLALFVFTVSTIFTNTAFGLGMGFGAYLSADIFMLLIKRIKLLSYMPTVNYNLTPYMFGAINTESLLTLPKAIIVDVVSFIVLTILAIIVFKKKDIKNQ